MVPPSIGQVLHSVVLIALLSFQMRQSKLTSCGVLVEVGQAAWLDVV